MQNSENPPICAMPGCGNPVSKTLRGKWRVHCSNSCRGKHNSLVGETARRATNKLRYGDEHPTRTADTQARRRANSLEKHGVEHQMHLPSVKHRVQQTCLDRYGVTNPNKSDKVKLRKVETSRKNYGVAHPSQSAVYRIFTGKASPCTQVNYCTTKDRAVLRSKDKRYTSLLAARLAY